MSKIAVNEITDEVGTGAPAFPNGMSATGAALTDPEITGGVYLGGTGSANKLDDYEEGTFTCDIEIDGSVGTSPVRDGAARYVKSGSMVAINVQRRIQGFPSPTGVVSIAGGLPFTPTEGFAIIVSSRAIGMENGAFLKVNSANSSIFTRVSNDSHDDNDVDNEVSTSDTRTIKVLEFSAVYYTNA